jgi:hypothetical protein
MSLPDAATRLLAAMATSDLDAVRAGCREDVVVWGTDEAERWDSLEPLLAGLDAMRPLGLSAEWIAPPAAGATWVAGLARYTGHAIEPMLVRVTMAFAEDGLLAHGHFSVEAPAS